MHKHDIFDPIIYTPRTKPKQLTFYPAVTKAAMQHKMNQSLYKIMRIFNGRPMGVQSSPYCAPFPARHFSSSTALTIAVSHPWNSCLGITPWCKHLWALRGRNKRKKQTQKWRESKIRGIAKRKCCVSMFVYGNSEKKAYEFNFF